MTFISDPFSLLGSPKSKLLLIDAAAGRSEPVVRLPSSLISEHVNAEDLFQEARNARHAPSAKALSDEKLLVSMRRWFWTRSANSGFCLSGFPRNALHSLVLDEWLEARGEALDACIQPGAETPSGEIANHYARQGLWLGIPTQEILGRT